MVGAFPDEVLARDHDVVASFGVNGKRRDEARDLVVANAAAALFVGGRVNTLIEAARCAEQSIDSGAARRKLEQLIQATNSTSSIKSAQQL